MGRITRRRRRLLLHGGKSEKTPKPKALCQCPKNIQTEEPCRNPIVPGTVFCKEHQDCPQPPLSGSEPVIDIKNTIYTKNPYVRQSHNCYAFAMQYLNMDSAKKCKEQGDCRRFFPQPGAQSGQRNALNAVDRRKCPVVEKLMLSDNPDIIKSSFYGKCPEGTSKVHMTTDEGNDYHFNAQVILKSDEQAGGSENKIIAPFIGKPGSNKVTDKDALGNRMFNPQQASADFRWQGSDLNYESPCGFYCVPRNRVVQLAAGGGGPGEQLGGVWKEYLQPRRRSTRKVVRRRLRKA